MSIAVALVLVASRAFAVELCPVGTHQVDAESGCQRCVDDAQESAGVLRYVEGETAYELAFVDAKVLRMERTLEGEPPVLQVADLRTGARVSSEVCGVELDLPTPSPAGLRWVDAKEKVVLIEKYFGFWRRNMRNLYAMPDGSYDVVGARRYPAPGAHMRGHWTDGYYHRRTLGSWRVTLENGSVERGQWAKGEPVGVWTVVATNGRVVERGAYAWGYPTGKWTCASDDGAVTTGRYRLGRQVGDWVTVDAAGAVVSTVTHRTTEESSQLRGRHWRGGVLHSRRVPSPCSPASAEVALIAKPSAAVARGVVRLRIADEDELALPGVLVTLDGGSQVVMTDGEGVAVFGPLLPGRHQVQTEKIGFGKVKGQFLLEEGGAAGVEVEIVMGYGGMGW